MLLAPLPFLSAGQVFADPFFNSSEPGCDGSDPNVLWCDDFEDGDWVQTDSGGYRDGNIITPTAETYPPNDGWAGDVYYPTGASGVFNKALPGPADSPNYAVCGGMGVAGTPCAATSGLRVPIDSQGWQGMMGAHSLKGRTNYTHIYHRYYIKPLTGFTWGHEKLYTYNPCCLQAGIILGNTSSYFGSGTPQMFVATEGNWRLQNRNLGPSPDHVGWVVDGATLQWFVLRPGNWYALQIEIDTLAGILRMWMDNCGANGLGCTGQPTLRMEHTNVNWGGKSIGTLWLETWSNAGSRGTTYFDQFKVSTVGPIGFSGQSNTRDRTPPPTPNPHYS